MSILEYNGGAVLAMTGKNCVAIASDTRFGIRYTTIATDYPKIHKMDTYCYVGLAGLATDQQTLLQRFKFRWNLYELKEERKMTPKVFANFVSSLLYEKRFGPYFCEPLVAGLQGPNRDEPFICQMDLIGAPVYAEDFVISGTSTYELFGMCESLWRPNLEPEELFEVTAQCLLSASNRDAFSGWGAVIHVISKDKTITRHLKARQD